MRTITTEEYEATCKWLRSKISMGEYISLNDVIIPLEWILELIENASPINIPPPMTTKECISIIEKSEWYPVYVISTNRKTFNNLEIPDALYKSYKSYKSALKRFDKIQDELEKIYKEVNE